jgi:glycolate oxidase FAD binding subunit
MKQGLPSDTQVARLEQLLGGARTITDSASLAVYEIDGVRPAAAVRPADAADVAELVRVAAAEQLAVIPCSGRSKLAVGGVPVRYDVALDLSAMNRVISYDPGDLTLSVEPGLRLEDLQRELGKHGQFLPLEVAFSERATVGGAIATSAYSPLRAHFGSARDFVLGMEFVTGLGEIAKSGGRVVKNVTGYDLHKLLIGSLGTLAVITRVHFRTFPRPAERRVFTAEFGAAGAALEFCRAVAASALEPWAIEMLDPGATEISGLGAQSGGGARAWRVVIAAAGSAAVVERHARDLERMARETQAARFEAWTGADAAKCLRAIREFVRLALEHSAAATILRIALLPASVAALAERLAAIADAHNLDAALAIGAAGSAGAGYVALWPRSRTRAEASSAPALDATIGASADRFEEALSNAVKEILEAASSDSGAARGFVERCPTALKRRISLWGEAGEDFVLMQRVKQIFDPHGVLAPGRYCGGL